jgi:hypothetical protein
VGDLRCLRSSAATRCVEGSGNGSGSGSGSHASNASLTAFVGPSGGIGSRDGYKLKPSPVKYNS